jgi:protein-arginine kinase activator protein McsA
LAAARAALATAIAAEDYEQAAKSRDEIAALEAALKPV